MPSSRRDVCTNSGKPLDGFLIRTKFLKSLYLPLVLWIPGFPKGLPEERAWTARRTAWRSCFRAHVFPTLPSGASHASRVTALCPLRLGPLTTFLREGFFFLPPYFWRRQCHGHCGSSEVCDEWVLFPHLTFMENYCRGWFPRLQLACHFPSQQMHGCRPNPLWQSGSGGRPFPACSSLIKRFLALRCPNYPIWLLSQQISVDLRKRHLRQPSSPAYGSTEFNVNTWLSIYRTNSFR